MVHLSIVGNLLLIGDLVAARLRQPLQSEVGPELMQGYRVSVRNAWLLEHFSESMYNLEDLPVLWAGPLPLTQWANIPWMEEG